MYVDVLSSTNPNISEANLVKQMQDTFAAWFEQYVRSQPNDVFRLLKHLTHSLFILQSQAEKERDTVGDLILDLARGPLPEVRTYPMYFVNGYRFHTEHHASKRATYNCGVCITAEYGDYNGILEEILEVEYPALPLKRCVLFRCRWFDPTLNRGTRVHDKYKSIEVLRKGKLNVFEPFILASQATQVTYVDYPSTSRAASEWVAVCKVHPRDWVDVHNAEDPTQDVQQDPFQEVETNVVNIVEDGVNTDVNLTGDGYASFDDANDEQMLDDVDEEPILSSEDSEKSLHTSDCYSSDSD
jgi:hypothetical protein